MINAKDFKCRKKGCEKQADIFLESTDVDILFRLPLCREHADDYKLRMTMVMYGDLTEDKLNKWLDKKDRTVTK
jgi:hypothetical protein